MADGRRQPAPPSGARIEHDARLLGTRRAALADADIADRNRDGGVKQRPALARPADDERVRPLGPEVDRAALDLMRRRGREILACARRYAANLDDADDAYQRGLEILLRKAPSTHEEDLVPWLKTVIKHEGFALRRHCERHAPVTHDG